MIFVPNVRAQSSSREWLQGRQSDLAGASLLWWPRPCFLASSPKEELEIIKAMTVLHKPVTAHRGRERECHMAGSSLARPCVEAGLRMLKEHKLLKRCANSAPTSD